MLTKKAEDDYLYYYNNGNRYAVLGLYIEPSLGHSTKMLSTTFDYPVTGINNIEMKVDDDLLNATINYTKFIAVSEDNRCLQFCVEVAPTLDVEFNITNHEHDKFSKERAIKVNDTVIAVASDGVALTVDRPNYHGYLKQRTKIEFNANSNFYSKATLKIDYIDNSLVDAELPVQVNNNIVYEFLGDAVVTITLEPMTYTLSAHVEYQGERYNVLTGEYKDITNASGVNIFNASNGVTIKINNANGLLYSEEIVTVSYNLNSSLKSDFTVVVYGNGNELGLNEAKTGYVTTVNGRNVEIVIDLSAKATKVEIDTNFNNEVVAQIYAQINNDEIIDITDSVNASYTQLELINGDKLKLYIKDMTGFRFTNYYKYVSNSYLINTIAGTGDYEGFTVITLFNSGFSLAQNGRYYLQFKQIPIEIEFKYVVTQPSLGIDGGAGRYYMANSDTDIVKIGSTITLNKGNDTNGYKFLTYSYGAPIDDVDDANEITLDANNQFVIEGDIATYLSQQEIVDDEIKFVIYINYAKQFTYNIVYNGDSSKVNISVANAEGTPLTQNLYYDYNTELYIDAKAIDTLHYALAVEVKIGASVELLNSNNMADDKFVEGSKMLTNHGHLSGFVACRNLIDNCTITITATAEEYDTKLIENKYVEIDNANQTSTMLSEAPIGYFRLTDNVYYRVQGTHNYGSKVTVTIFVLEPVDKAELYYELSNVTLNGNEIEVNYTGTGGIGGQVGKTYKIEYNLTGDDLPVECQLEINLKALYYVEIV